MGLLFRADGSAYYEQGNTKILAAVYGPREVTHSLNARHDRGIINCEYSMASFSTGERKKRTKGDRRAVEIALIIQQVFEAAVLLELSPKSQIDIYIQVLQADGGETAASINAACLALIDAGVPMRDFVVACAAGLYDKTPIIDLNHFEDTSGSPDMPVAILPKTGKISMLQMDSKLHIDAFEQVRSFSTSRADYLGDDFCSERRAKDLRNIISGGQRENARFSQRKRPLVWLLDSKIKSEEEVTCL